MQPRDASKRAAANLTRHQSLTRIRSKSTGSVLAQHFVTGCQLVPMTLRQLEQTFRRVSHLQHVSAILQWDEAVMMASAGGDERARAMAILGSVVHEHVTAPEVTDWLASAEAVEGGAGPQARSVPLRWQKLCR